MSEIIAQAFRAGFKAGAEHVIGILELSQLEFANYEVFDESALALVGIIVAELRKVIDESVEVL